MRLDDRFMTVMTALVLIIAIGALVHSGGSSLFGGGGKYLAQNDTYTLRAGRLQVLDVLLNDKNVESINTDDLVVQAPTCGRVEAIDGSVQFSDSTNCEGAVAFSYCVPIEGQCDFAAVTVNILSEGQESEQIVATARPTPTARPTDGSPQVFDQVQEVTAPQQQEQQIVMRPARLVIPESSDVVTPSESVENIRTRPASGSAVVVSSDIGNSNFSVSNSSARAGGVAIAGAEMQAPTIGGEENDITIAGLSQPTQSGPSRPRAPSAPTLGGGSDQPIAAIEQGPRAQVLVDGQSDIKVDVTESSGVLASIARGDSVLGATFDAARSLFEPTQEGEDTALQADKITSAPRPTNVQLAESLQPEIAEDSALALPLPQAEREIRSGRAPQIARVQAEIASVDLDTSAPVLLPSPAPAAPEVAIETPVEAPAEETIEVAAADPTDTVETPVIAEPVTVERPVAADCGVTLTAEARIGAEVLLNVTSPCRPETDFTVEHAGLKFTATTDGEGAAEIAVPAMAKEATLAVSFTDGGQAEANATVSDLSRVSRVAVVWDASIDVDLHALEYGARVDTPGHVWSGNAKDYRDARRGGGGYLVVLGPEGQTAGAKTEIYSVPRSSRNGDGLIQLSLRVEDQVSACQDNLVVKTVRAESSDTPLSRDVQVGLNCGSDDRLVLENVIQDIRMVGQ